MGPGTRLLRRHETAASADIGTGLLTRLAAIGDWRAAGLVIGQLTSTMHPCDEPATRRNSLTLQQIHRGVLLDQLEEILLALTPLKSIHNEYAHPLQP